MDAADLTNMSLHRTARDKIHGIPSRKKAQRDSMAARVFQSMMSEFTLEWLGYTE